MAKAKKKLHRITPPQKLQDLSEPGAQDKAQAIYHAVRGILDAIVDWHDWRVRMRHDQHHELWGEALVRETQTREHVTALVWLHAPLAWLEGKTVNELTVLFPAPPRGATRKDADSVFLAGLPATLRGLARIADELQEYLDLLESNTLAAIAQRPATTNIKNRHSVPGHRRKRHAGQQTGWQR